MTKEQILNDVKEHIIHVLNLDVKADHISATEPLYSSLIGLDSAGLLKTILKAEEQYHIEINDEDIMETDLETVEDLATLILHKLDVLEA